MTTVNKTYYTKDDLKLQWLRDSEQDSGFPFKALAANYDDYVKELKSFSRHVEDNKLYRPEDNPETCYTIIWLETDEGVCFAGFFFYGIYPNALTKHDAYIGEFYIRPEYRECGVATAVFDMILESARAQMRDISYFCLNRNHRAQRLWNKILTKNGYEERLSRGSIFTALSENPDCRFYYWTKDEIA